MPAFRTASRFIMTRVMPFFAPVPQRSQSGLVFTRLLFAFTLAAAALGVFSAPQPAQAAILTVTSTADSGPGSLRQVIAAAAAGDTLLFDLPEGSIITLASEITVNKSLSLAGPGRDLLAISGEGVTRIFNVTAGTLRMGGLSLMNGVSRGQDAVTRTPGLYSAMGGAIYIGPNAGVTATNVAFYDNSAVGGRGGDGVFDDLGGAGGGGGGQGGAMHAAGGFGGGGGGGYSNTAFGQGGQGGFAGGGGGSTGGNPIGTSLGYGGSGGYFAGVGYAAGGGGGATGGAIFIAAGGALGLNNVYFEGNAVTGGRGGNATSFMGGSGGGGGAALGSAIFSSGALCVQAGVTFNLPSLTAGAPGVGNCGYGGCASGAATAGQALDTSPGVFETSANHSCTVWYYPPTNLIFTPVSLDENMPAGTPAGSFISTDADSGDSFTYSLVAGTGSTDNASFRISGSSLQTNLPLDYEAKAAYSIRVRTTDSHGLFFEQTFTVTIHDVLDQPTGITLTGPIPAEHQPAGLSLGSLATIAQGNTGLVYTYSLVNAGPGCPGSDNGAFSITGSTISTTRPLDYETEAPYDVCIRTVESTTPTMRFDQPFSIDVTDINEAPTAIQVSNTSLAEGLPGASLVGLLSASDLDLGQTYQYALVQAAPGCPGTDNASAAIHGSELWLNQSQWLDYEAKNSYNLCLRVTDSGSPALSYTAPVTVSITNVNEVPTAVILSPDNLDENVLAGTIIGSLSSSDPDSGQTFTYALVDGGPSCPGSGNADFNIAGDRLTARSTFNYEIQASYALCVQTTDSGSPAASFNQPLTVRINDLNDAPTAILLSANTIAENQPAGTLLANLSSVDEESSREAFTYALVNNAACGVNDNASFSVSAGQLLSAQPFDYETRSSYRVCLQTTDNGVPALSSIQAFDITVTDVNDAPTRIDLSNASLAENQPIGFEVGQLTTQDAEAGSQTYTYSLVNPGGACSAVDNASFAISGDRLQTAAVLDFETQASYHICVQSTDSGSPAQSVTAPFTIRLMDVNEAASAVLLSNASVAENQPAGSLVGNLSSTDPDSAQTFTYSLLDGPAACGGGGASLDNASFQIVGSQLQTTAALDFETQPSLHVCIRSTDSGSPALSLDQGFTIQVTDVNETPLAGSLPDQSGVVGLPFTYSVPAATFSDPDGDPLTLSASLTPGALPAWLSFDPLTGTFSGTPDRPLNLHITVSAGDGRGGTASSAFWLNVATQTGNQPPFLVLPIPNVAASIPLPFTFTFAPSTFADPDGDPLSYLAQTVTGSTPGPLPAWLRFDPLTRTFSGLPWPVDQGVLTVRVIAMDGKGGEAADDFLLGVGANVPPSLLLPIPDQSAALGQLWRYSLPPLTFVDPNSDLLSYSARMGDGSPLPAWLSFDPLTHTFSGTPPSSAAAPLVLELEVTVSDGNGGTASDRFLLSPWSTQDRTAILPPGSRVSLADMRGSGPLAPPPGARRLLLTVDITIHSGNNILLTQLPGIGIQVCFAPGPAEMRLSGGAMNRLAIGTLHTTATAPGVNRWRLLATRYDPSSRLVCASANQFSLFDLFLLPASSSSSEEDGPASLPATGFAPGRVTALPPQPAQSSYSDLGDVWLEIPALQIKSGIVGVPRTGSSWDVSWLGQRAGWLEGSAFPGWSGNSVLTGHVVDNQGQPSMFGGLRGLAWGQTVFVHALGVKYVYEVRAVDGQVSPADGDVLRHEERPWLTLVTCSGYRADQDNYRYRTVVRAVLVKTEKE